MAQRDASGGWRTLTYAQTLWPCDAIARGAAATRSVAGTADRDPVRQRYRARAARARRDACRHPLCAGLAGLFAAVAGFRQAAKRSSTFSRRAWSLPPTARPSRAPSRQPCRRMSKSWLARIRSPTGRPRCSTTFLTTQPTPAVEAAHAQVGPDTIAKVPVHLGLDRPAQGRDQHPAMLCANQSMIRCGFPFLADEPPVLVDWPPWSHTFGGNHDFGMVLDNGGSFYIDEGKPLPGAIEATVRNLRESRRRSISTCPRATRCCCPICAATRNCARGSSAD